MTAPTRDELLEICRDALATCSIGLNTGLLWFDRDAVSKALAATTQAKLQESNQPVKGNATTPTRDELLKLAGEAGIWIPLSKSTHEYDASANAVLKFAAHQAQAEPKPSNADADLSAIYDLFGIGSGARTIGVLLTNVSNTLHLSKLLHAIEREFFMVPGEQDEDFPDEEPDDECLVNSWGATKEQYIEQFRAALDRLRPLAPPSSDQTWNEAIGEKRE